MIAGFFVRLRTMRSSGRRSADGLAREPLGMRVCLGDRLRVVGPARRDDGKAGLLEERNPLLPARRQKPEAVDEDDGRPVGGIRLLDLARQLSAQDRSSPVRISNATSST